MKKTFGFMAFAAAGLAAFGAVPQVTINSSVIVDGKVKVRYTLADAPAIVTMCLQVNTAGQGETPVWEAVGEDKLTAVSGDVNVPVETGTHQFFWNADQSWPEQQLKSGNFRVGVKAWALDYPPLYMAVNLAKPNTVRYFSSEAAVPGGANSDAYKTEWLLMRRIPAKDVTWTMGSPETELGHRGDETQHQVTLTNDFYIGVFETTQAQWVNMKGANPSTFQSQDDYLTCPVETVSWEAIRGGTWPAVNGDASPNADSFVAKMRAHAGLSSIDLPVEAQWEFACRAGTATALYSGVNITSDDYCPNLYWLARYRYTGAGTSGPTAKVGSFAPNAWGLYDMYGNVWEYCADWYWWSAYNPDNKVDPNIGPTEAHDSGRVIRGGGYDNPAAGCRSAMRTDLGTTSPAYRAAGFRVMCPIPVR